MKKEILRIGFKPLTLVNKLIKKDKNLIFFYSNLGFRDNVRAFYEYLIENGYNKKYRIAVSVNDYEKYTEGAPANVEFMSNKAGIKTFMRARYAFYCFGKYPIKPAAGQTVVNLWHGTPLKKIGNLEVGHEKTDYNYFTFVLTNSEMYREIMTKIFGCKTEQTEVLGNPRSDEMFRSDNIQDVSIRRGCGKLILWLPTYREYDENFVINLLSGEDLMELNRYLKENDCRMIIKFHPLQKVDAALRFSHIEFVTQPDLEEQNMTVYTLLRNADGLITDYSSVYIDYLLLDRQIAFAVDDMELYAKKRGFVMKEPEKYMPGPKIRTLNEVKEFISNVISGADDYAQDRARVNDIMNYYKDGENCKRIAERFLRD